MVENSGQNLITILALATTSHLQSSLISMFPRGGVGSSYIGTTIRPGKGREEIQKVPINWGVGGAGTTTTTNTGENKCLQKKLRRHYEGAEYWKDKNKKDKFHYTLLDLKSFSIIQKA